jgi:tRNA threonylcarbamoyladenosine biosynthesis protein TsaE
MPSHQQFLSNEDATENFGRCLAKAISRASADHFKPAEMNGKSKQINCGGTLYLIGELGAGKTTLTRGLMRGYGYQGAVKSPTYTLVEPYEIGNAHIVHFDLYRLVEPEEMEYLGVDDYFSGNNLCVVEWPDKGGTLVPPADLIITLDIEREGRSIEVQATSERWQSILSDAINSQ